MFSWDTLRDKLLYDLLFLERLQRGNINSSDDEVTEEFMDEFEERTGVDFNATCHAMFTISEELTNLEGGNVDDNNNKERRL